MHVEEMSDKTNVYSWKAGSDAEISTHVHQKGPRSVLMRHSNPANGLLVFVTNAVGKISRYACFSMVDDSTRISTA